MNSETYEWTGEHSFEINGSGLHEDTLRIVQNYKQSEQMLKLTLPTLCITYADMAFQNAVGGQQMNYPGSARYGPVHFDPPVVLTGDDIEKYTYIRGAYRVEIGSDKTIIEFPCWKDLVIPRLRLDESPGTPALLEADTVQIFPDTPFKIIVKQYADGRHVGGITVESRHPKYIEPDLKPEYDLWVHVIDAKINYPLQETIVEIWRWDSNISTPYGSGEFVIDSQHYTNGNGVVQLSGLPAGELQWYTVRLPGWRIAPRCLRPLAGQQVRFHMRAWPLMPDTVRYTWRKGDTLTSISQLTGRAELEILDMNHLHDSSALSPGMQITLPCYAATYRPESWETLDWIGRTFGYGDAKGIAEVNGLLDVSSYDGSFDLKFPDWRFFYAREHDTLDAVDETFGLPKGSAITVGRLFRPYPRLLFPGETIAVPTPRFAKTLLKQREG